MNKEKNTKLIFKNNFYFLKKAFKFEPLYFITKLLYNVMLELRGAFLWVFLMQYMLSQFESNTPPLKIINFLVAAFLIVSFSYILQHSLDKTYFRIKNKYQEFTEGSKYKFIIIPIAQKRRGLSYEYKFELI